MGSLVESLIQSPVSELKIVLLATRGLPEVTCAHFSMANRLDKQQHLGSESYLERRPTPQGVQCIVVRVSLS